MCPPPCDLGSRKWAGFAEAAEFGSLEAGSFHVMMSEARAHKYQGMLHGTPSLPD